MPSSPLSCCLLLFSV
uniref:Uncharacterized protein n=1 Tax=Arundo donax TaxID=35708 RepID=A0A0A8XX62_ARUDO